LKAWDNFNNSSLITRTVEVVSTDGLRLSEVMNYPNPVREGSYSTSFQYCLNSDADRVSIRIFTESGARIKTIELTTPDMTQTGCHQVDWNLRDADGDNLANGIYLYQIEATGADPGGRKIRTDQAGKLVILW